MKNQKTFAIWKVFGYISAPRRTARPLRPGEVSERLKEHAWKVCIREIVSWVRIPPSPPLSILKSPENCRGFRAFSFEYRSHAEGAESGLVTARGHQIAMLTPRARTHPAPPAQRSGGRGGRGG